MFLHFFRTFIFKKLQKSLRQVSLCEHPLIEDMQLRTQHAVPSKHFRSSILITTGTLKILLLS